MKNIFILFGFFNIIVNIRSVPFDNNDDDVEGQSRIYNGKIARPKQFPYQVGINFLDEEGINNMWCGGSLITQEWVLTAAHCIYKKDYGFIMLGRNNKSKKDNNNSETFMFFLKDNNHIIHEDYNSTSKYADIALIKLTHPVNISDSIQTIDLQDEDWDFTGEIAILSGWGRTGDGKPSSDSLQYANLKVISRDECKQLKWFVIGDKQFCTDSSKSQGCSGDSGGPLVITKNGKLVQVGIVSYGGVSCQVKTPVVYTAVYPYLDWIRKHTGMSAKVKSVQNKSKSDDKAELEHKPELISEPKLKPEPELIPELELIYQDDENKQEEKFNIWKWLYVVKNWLIEIRNVFV